MNLKVLFLFATLVTLMACSQAPANQPSNPTTSSSVLGSVELSFDSSGEKRISKVSPRAALPDNAASFTPFTFVDIVSANTRYLSATFTVTNNSGAAFDNLTLYAFNQAGSSIGGTGIKNLINFGGGAITADSVAQSLLL